jgi:hypothetical protein
LGLELKVSANDYLEASLLARDFFRSRNFPVLRSVLLVLTLTLIAIVADHFAAPILLTTSPLWATFAFLLLVWRRGELPLSCGNAILERPFPMWRLSMFVGMHVALILLSRSFAGVIEPFAGTPTWRGTLVGLCKLAVLIPTVVLFSFPFWKQLLRAYSSEAKAALLVLSINVPGRILESLWPWYGRVLVERVEDVRAHVQKLDIPVVHVTHQIEEAKVMGQHRLLLDSGRLVKDTNELATSPGA